MIQISPVEWGKKVKVGPYRRKETEQRTRHRRKALIIIRQITHVLSPMCKELHVQSNYSQEIDTICSLIYSCMIAQDRYHCSLICTEHLKLEYLSYYLMLKVKCRHYFYLHVQFLFIKGSCTKINQTFN